MNEKELKEGCCKKPNEESSSCCSNQEECCPDLAKRISELTIENENLKSQLQEQEIKYNSALEKFFYTQQEFKRLMEQQNKNKEVETMRLIKKFGLGLIRSLEIIEKVASISEGNAKQGVEMSFYELQDTLANLGIKEIGYDQLNPEYHEVVETTNDPEKPTDSIVEVKSKGYLYNNFVVKLAQVVVNKN